MVPLARPPWLAYSSIMNKHSLEWFWDGCEAQGPLKVLVKLPGQPQTRECVLHQPFAVIGRDPRAHLRLEDMRVSLRHAYFQMIAGRLFVIDLGSPTGIHATSGPLRAAWLSPGVPVGIGPYWLRWLHDPPTGPSAEVPGFDPHAARPAANSLMPLSLEFLNGKATRARWTVDRTVTLFGSAAACKVRLRSSRVSAYHCSVIWTTRGAWVVDLLGEGGVRLNGVPVPLAALEHDDRLQVGEFVIRVCCGASAEAPQARRGLPRSRTRNEDLLAVSGPEAGDPRQDAAVNGRSAVHPVPASAGPMPSFADPGAALLHAGALMRLPELAPPEGVTDPTHAALLPLVSQFGAMQEQMADQFRQTLMIMFQMFSALHKDQMAFFQQEMDRVQQLTQELHLLQIEEAKHAPPPVSPAPQARQTAARSSPAPQPARAASGTAPQPPLPPPSAGPAPARTEGGFSPGACTGHDIHIWLSQRMAAVQEERQTRWQKLLGLLGGKPADAS